MPKELHESSVQPRKKSEITPMGGHPASNIPLRISSKGSLSFLITSMKGARRSSEGRSTVFSTPSSGPSTLGNGITEIEISGFLETLEWMPGKFAGVVMMVTLIPQRARSLERSSIGRVWPCAMKGKTTTWRGVADPIINGDGMNSRKIQVGCVGTTVY